MKVTLFLFALLIISYSLKIPKYHIRSKHLQTPGGYSPIDVNNLSTQVKDIDSYIKKNFNQVQGLTLVSGQTQVVSGMNYKLTYSDNVDTTLQFIVYDQPWTNTRKVTSVKKSQKKKNQKGQYINNQRTIVTSTNPYNDVIRDLLK